MPALLIAASPAWSQHAYEIKADTLLIHKTGAAAELILENSTKHIKGMLHNRGNGSTIFYRPALVNAGGGKIAVEGEDPVEIGGGSGSGIDSVYWANDFLHFRLAGNWDSTAARYVDSSHFAPFSGSPYYIQNAYYIPLANRPQNASIDITGPIVAGVFNSTDAPMNAYAVAGYNKVMEVRRGGNTVWSLNTLDDKAHLDDSFSVSPQFSIGVGTPKYMFYVKRPFGTPSADTFRMAAFNGRVIGLAAVREDELIVKSQLNNTDLSRVEQVTEQNADANYFFDKGHTVILGNTTVRRNLSLPAAWQFKGRILVIKPKASPGSTSQGWSISPTLDEGNGQKVTFTISTEYTIQSDGENWIILASR